MVANGSRRHPLHSHYSRIHSNPEEYDVFGGGAVAEGKKKKSGGKKAAPAQVVVVAAEAAPAKKGRTKLSDSERKRRAKAAAEKRRAAGPSEKQRLRKQLTETLSSLLKVAAGKKKAAKQMTEAEKAAEKLKKEEAKNKKQKTVKDLREKLKAANALVKARTHFPSLKIKPEFASAIVPRKKKGEVAKNPKQPLSESEKARRAEARKANAAANTHKVGPYKISLLKNPVTDFEIGGVKVVPALAGAAGAIALSQLVRNLPFVANMQPGIVRDILPGAVTVAAGVAGLYYAKKNASSGMLKDLSEDLAAYGMFVGLNDAVGAKIHDMVDNVKKKPAAAPAAAAPANGMHGGAFMNGGGWVGGVDTSALSGYHMSGPSAGYPPAFSLDGGEGYFVPSNLALNGYHMSGDANSAATAAAITALNGGAFREQAIGGIDMSDYQD